MDMVTLAIALSKIQQVKKELRKEDFKVQVEQDRSILNRAGQEKILYFLPAKDTESSNAYDEYIYVNNTWEQVGSTKIDLSNYYQKNEINELLNSKEDIITEEELTEIVTGLYPQATTEEVRDMVDSLLENYSTTTEAMIDFIIQHQDDQPGAEYAPLQSPHFTGIPTAPTAVRGTNTEQIATTAFVQEAIKPAIIISVSDLPAGTNLVVTLTLQDDDMPYSVSAAVDANGIATMLLEYTGTYAITYNNNKIKSRKTIDITVPTVYNLSAVYSELIVYTVNIDKNNSNPKTACTYADNAENMVKGSAEWDNMPIFKHIRPCVFYNGEVNYYLDPNDWTKKYGTNETSVLTGEDGDVMIEFPKFAYKIKTVDNIITVSVTNDESVVENDSEYTYDAFSRLTEGDVDYFYKGAFKGSLDSSGQLRSIVGTKPAANKTIGAFRTAAQSNGAHYQQSTYAQLKALQCLYLIKYGDRNGQAEVGNGVVNASGSYVSGYNTTDVASIAPELSTLASGMTFGTTANNTTHMRLFGIEDFWGCIWEWVDGLTTDGERNVITSWNSFSGEGVESTSVTTPSGLASNASGYIRDVIGNNAAGFMPNNFSGGSSSTHWSDGGYLYASCVLVFGGHWNYGGQAGPFRLIASFGASYAAASLGARLSFV